PLLPPLPPKAGPPSPPAVGAPYGEPPSPPGPPGKPPGPPGSPPGIPGAPNPGCPPNPPAPPYWLSCGAVPVGITIGVIVVGLPYFWITVRKLRPSVIPSIARSAAPALPAASSASPATAAAVFNTVRVRIYKYVLSSALCASPFHAWRS